MQEIDLKIKYKFNLTESDPFFKNIFIVLKLKSF